MQPLKRRWDVIGDLICRHALKRGAEIGVAEGRFTDAVLRAHPGLHMIAVDHWQPGYLTWRGDVWNAECQMKNRRAFMEILQEFCDRLILVEVPSVDAARFIPDKSLDFVFIDAGHSYQECFDDIGAWCPKVRQGGFVTGHDYNETKFPGVVRAVKEAFEAVTLGPDDVWIWQKT